MRVSALALCILAADAAIPEHLVTTLPGEILLLFHSIDPLS
jgi:hypothetical protein